MFRFISLCLFLVVTIFSFSLNLEAKKIVNKDTIASLVQLVAYEDPNNLGSYSTGTGFFISSDALILTNAHVVTDENNLVAPMIHICHALSEFELPDCLLTAEVLAFDADLDLALLAPLNYLDENGNENGAYFFEDFEDMGFSYVDLSDYIPQLGEEISVLGYPAGPQLGTMTLTEGIVSGYQPLVNDLIYFVLTDATVNPGNSGGPVYDELEKVIGVATGVRGGNDHTIGGSYGFVISNETIWFWFNQLVEDGVLRREYVEEVFANDELFLEDWESADIDWDDLDLEDALEDVDFSFFDDLMELNHGDYSNETLNPFTDVSSNHQNWLAITTLKSMGIIEGYPDGSFGPNNSLNRAELLKILVEGLDFHPSKEIYRDCFPDVADQWYAKYVCYAKERGWVEGYEDGNFRPANPVNKVEAIKMLLEIYDVPLKGNVGNPFSDVAGDAWYTNYLLTAHDFGILMQKNGLYGPGSSISRAEIMENLYRLLFLEY